MNHPTESNTPHEENRFIAERREKLAELRKQGLAYPNNFKPENKTLDLHKDFGTKSKEDLEEQQHMVKVAGRIMLKRVMGRASFATIQDSSGRIQLYLDKKTLGDYGYDLFKSSDIGDIVGVVGSMYKTNKGELSIHVTEIKLLSKALRPLPDKFHGLSDQEIRYRQRYVDLIMNESTRTTFLKRCKTIECIRKFMLEHQFIEVETPMLHPIPGGAAAKPFVTHHNALDIDMYLRIAPELFLKRLIVGGFERVFEINRNFRNEGVSLRHNPEFTMMEFYAAYTEYKWLMNFTEELLRTVANSICGSTSIEYQGKLIDFKKPFDRLTILESINKYAPQYTSEQLTDKEYLLSELHRLGADINGPVLSRSGIGALQLALFEETTEEKLWNPTFIIDYPSEVSPLSRASDEDASISERFELFIAGRELANGFSELNDPEDQAARFMAQVEAKDAGDEEAMYYDADYIRALEYGMAPTGGCGIGIDRLVMLLTDSPSIREVILFPHMRPESKL